MIRHTTVCHIRFTCALLAWAWISTAAIAEKPKVPLIKLPVTFGEAMENTPVIFGGRALLVLNRRDDTKNPSDEYTKTMYLYIRDLATGQEVARFGKGHSFVSAFVNGPEMHVFASEGTNRDWFKSIYHFVSTDLKTWKRELAIPLEGNQHLFNCSVCRDEQGYVMAYELDKPVMFCFKFARSKDLSKWEKVPGLTFTGKNNEYSACPVIRYFAPYYYVIYLHEAIPGHKGWVPFMARSKDLATWQLSPLNPIMEAGAGEGLQQLRHRPVRVGRQHLRVLRHRRSADVGERARGPFSRTDEEVLRELLSAGIARR